MSHPPSPSFYSPSPSPYSPSSSNVFQFPPAPYTDITSTIKEELLPWTIPPASISSPSHTPTYCSPSPSPLLSQSATKPPPAIFPSQPVSYVPETIRLSNTSFPSYSTSYASPYYFHKQMTGTFGHTLTSFHHNSTTNLEVVSSLRSYNTSPPGSGYSSPAPDLGTDVFQASSQHDTMFHEISAAHPSISAPATVDPLTEPVEEDHKDSIKQDTDEDLCEEDQVVQCKWKECAKEFCDKDNLVEHINITHIEHKKGCEDYPCYWRVSTSPPILSLDVHPFLFTVLSSALEAFQC